MILQNIVRRVSRYAALFPLLLTASTNTAQGAEVVVYVSEDQVFSEPVLKDFERETNIKVKAVFDTEETKSTGVINRLLAEKDHPRADVYWANEPIRAVVLKQKGIAAPYVSPQAAGIPAKFKDAEGYWTGFSARARVLIVRQHSDGSVLRRTNSAEAPASILDYVNPEWKGKGVIANPLFGTTTSWVASLFTAWGDQKAREFMEQMKANDIAVSTSNGESTAFVVNGQYVFSLVDSDDAVNMIRAGKPIRQIYPDQEPGGLGLLLLPNALVLVKGGPNPENGRQLIDYLLSPETECKLAFADCAQIPLHEGVETPPDVPKIEALKTMDIDYGEVGRKLQEIQGYLKKWAGL